MAYRFVGHASLSVDILHAPYAATRDAVMSKCRWEWEWSGRVQHVLASRRKAKLNMRYEHQHRPTSFTAPDVDAHYIYPPLNRAYAIIITTTNYLFC